MSQQQMVKKIQEKLDSEPPRQAPVIIPAAEAKALRAQVQCVNKSRYPSESKATKYAQASADRIQKEIVIYECDLCNEWHLSSNYIPPKYLNGRPKAQSMVFPRKIK